MENRVEATKGAILLLHIHGHDLIRIKPLSKIPFKVNICGICPKYIRIKGFHRDVFHTEEVRGAVAVIADTDVGIGVDVGGRGSGLGLGRRVHGRGGWVA